MIKVLTDKSLYLYRDADGKQHCRAEIVCDTCSELVGVVDYGGIYFDFGSVALVAKDGEVCVLASDNKWYKQSNGSEVTA